jgi:ADP-heptose:LPS heptosyltransferase
MPESSATLVIRPEKLGDLVIATPVFKALKQQFPESPLHLVTDSIFAEAVSHDPHVDRIIPIQWTGRGRGQRESWSQIYGKLRETRYARAAILYYNVEAWNWMMLLLRVPDVAQLGGTYSAILLRQKMALRKGYAGRRHFAEWYLDVARRLGASVTDSQPRLYLTQAEIAAFRARFPFMDEPGRKIILHPFGHGSSPNYSIECYARLAEILAADPALRIFITGGRGEAAGWPQLTPPNIDRSWLGTLSIREWIVASSLTDLVIAGSTGVIHAAAAAGARTLGIYCPALGSHPDIWGARSPRAANLVAPESFCKKMGRATGPCTGDNSCDLAGAISPDQVAAKTIALLAARHPDDIGSPAALDPTNI